MILYNIKKMSNYKETNNTIIKKNNYIEKKEPKSNIYKKSLENNKSSNNTPLKNNINNLNSINNNKEEKYNTKTNYESKSFNKKKGGNNLINNIKHNKYLIPIIEKKNIDNNIYQKIIKETPFYLSDFFSKVRNNSENSERNWTQSENNNNNNNNSKDNYNHNTENLSKKNINYKNINNNNRYRLNNQISIHEELNNYTGYNNEDNNGHYITDYSQNNSHYNTVSMIKRDKFPIPYYISDKNKRNKIDNIKYKYKHSKYISSLTNKDLFKDIRENGKYLIDDGGKIIYPKIINDSNDNNKSNYYIKKINIKDKKRNRKDGKKDFENYLQKKKLFLIYRAKLFKLLYKNLVKIFNNHTLDLKNIAFQKIKQKKYSTSKKKKNIRILHRIFPYPNNLFKKNQSLICNNNKNNNKIKKNNSIFNQIMKSINTQGKENKNDNKRRINSLSTKNNCAQFIKRKNQSESKRNGEDSSELCRNINDLREKYEEIQKRKILENHHNDKSNHLYNNKTLNIQNNNSNKNYKNIAKYIYKKKKLDNYGDKYNTSYIRSNSNKSNKKKKKYINKNIVHFNENINNSLENIKNLNDNHEINKNNIMKRLNNIYLKRKKDKKYCIRKKIKNIRSSDKRLFVNINYVYSSNIDMKGKNIKYNEKLLEIKNPDNFSISKKKYNNNYVYNSFRANGNILSGIVEENESSIINYTDSFNSMDCYKKGNKNKYKNIYNDKYLYSCINFITKNINRIILKKTYNFFKKKIYDE